MSANRGFTPLETCAKARGFRVASGKHTPYLKLERQTSRSLTGFTFLEVMIALAIMAILFTAVLFTVNPARQLADARNNERRAHLRVLIGVIGQNIADNNGSFNCISGTIPAAASTMADNDPSAGEYNIAPCLVPLYLNVLPIDPVAPTARYAGVSDYSTAYTIARDAVTGRITLGAPAAELGETIEITR